MPVNARRFIRKMRGGAQAHLLEADDGDYYIVKFQNNPQHRRILVNEFVAAEILDPSADLVPRPSGSSASRPNSSPPIRKSTCKRARAAPRSLPAGTSAPVTPAIPNVMAIYDFIPDALLNQVANPEQFLAVLAFDRWVANADGRQSIFFRAQLKDWLARPGIPPRKLGFVALMIDHGFAFNGPHWDFPDSAVTGLYPRRIVYDAVRSLADFEPWMDRILNFPTEVFDKALRQIPPQWLEDDGSQLDRLFESLLRRRKRIPELLNDCRKAPGNPFPHWL